MSRILVIEDNGDLQQLLSLSLFKEGYEVHYAFNGKEGWDKMLSLAPDLVVLDLMMPILSGDEVAKLASAHAQTRDIPIIVMTAHGERPGHMEAALRAHGVREYVRKPFEISHMIALIGRTLAARPPRSGPAETVSKGVVRMDTRFRTVWIDGKVVATLSPNKAHLLRRLIESAGAVKREKLLADIWGGAEHNSALEKTVQRLREDLGPEGRRIQTTPEGYELLG